VRVLFVTTAYPTPASPAAGVFVREHARAAARHADVAVVHLDRSHGHRGAPRLQRVEGEDLPTWRVTYAWSPMPLSAAAHFVAAAKAWRAVRRSGFRPDVLHAHFFLAGVPSVLAGRLSRVPVVVAEHWSIFLPEDPMRLTAALRAGASAAYRYADAVLPVSEALRRGIESQGLTARRFEIVRNVVDTELFSPGEGERNGRLLAVGLLYEAKGYDVLLGSLAKLAREGRDVELDIVGDGPRRAEYEALARAQGVSERVRFHGLLPKVEVARLMREAELFVLASRYDNNPCALMEALASGLPAVATSVGGVPELISADNGRLAKPGDADALAGEIAAALDTIDAYDRAAIARDARERYGVESIAAQLADVYASVTGRRQR
jgi:glycosyltransferase involved in cell wall biosynthesis